MVVIKHNVFVEMQWPKGKKKVSDDKGRLALSLETIDNKYNNVLRLTTNIISDRPFNIIGVRKLR